VGLFKLLLAIPRGTVKEVMSIAGQSTAARKTVRGLSPWSVVYGRYHAHD
jgi:hypothetical protein